MLPQVTFRGLAPSPSIVESVWKKARKLGELEPSVRSCHVVIEATSRASHGPQSFKVTVQLSGGTNAARRAARHSTDSNVQVALRDAFRATRRQLESRDKHARSMATSQWRAGIQSHYGSA
jgi:hypothetical protein